MVGPIIIPVNDDLYVVKRIYPEADEFTLCWQMLRGGSEPRTVTMKDGAITCDCESFIMRMGPKGLACKHIDSLQEVGLLKGRGK